MTPVQLSRHLADVLGDRLPPAWREAYRAVPRHLFIPDQAWRAADGAREDGAIDRTVDPQGWLEAVYSPDIIVTQHNERGRATSSCSMPEMVFGMLDVLDVQPGQKALEIGTGTGWNAGLLAHRLGAGRVVSVEVDPEVADGARKVLATAGWSLLVVTGDGADGYAVGAPYDRVIATCTVHRVPYPWVAQARPGGLVVAPVGTPFDPGGIVQLVVDDEGRASGRFVLRSAFMIIRGQEFHASDEPDDFDQLAERSQATDDVSRILDGEDSEFAISLAVPGCRVGYDWSDDGTWITTVWLLAADSWASVDTSSGQVHQLGARRLWDEVEAAYRWWENAGQPEYTRFGITVTPDRQWAWLDQPDREIGAL